VFPTAADPEPTTRRPPGIALDPPAELPDARRSAPSGEGLVVLETPRDVERARSVIATFFRAVAAESLADLVTLLDERGRLWGGSNSRRESLQSAWARRLNQLDYGVLAGRLVYRESDLELYRAEEAAVLLERRSLPLSPREDELVARVPLLSPAPGGTRLFGDDLVFVLRPEPGGSFRIGEVYEDFRLP
jgi:hypothetical protein